MPTTRKKVLKTVYKDEDDSEAGDFSDSGSEAVISDASSSEDEDYHETDDSPGHRKKIAKSKSERPKKIIFAKKFIAKVIEQPKGSREDDVDTEPTFSVKDLTDANKLLPSILNLSDSDSSDDEAPRTSTTSNVQNIFDTEDDIKIETCSEYKDVWSHNLKQCEEIAKNTFLELEQHRSKLEETKQSIEKYKLKKENTKESDVKHLLALGEEKTLTPTKTMRKKHVKAKNDSDSEMEDWEEVAEGKGIPQQGIQLVVGFPETASRKTKQIDKQMMIKRRINRVKKEYQIYMHKVHVLCWLGHGNFVSHVLNDRDVMSAALCLIPSKECYPNERVDLKYIEQITTWYKDKLSVKLDKNEGKFRPKAPPLKMLLLDQIKTRIVTSKKYFVFIFVSMLRAIGLQCRIVLNFTTVPLKPPNSELCSLSTKQNSSDSSKKEGNTKKEVQKNVNKTKKTLNKQKDSDKIPQLDGNYDCLNDDYFDNIMQLDGNDDTTTPKTKRSLALKTKKQNPTTQSEEISPPKRSRRNITTKKNNSGNDELSQENISNVDNGHNDHVKMESNPVTRKSLSLRRNPPVQPNQDNSRQINTIKKVGDNKTRKCKGDIKPGLETANDMHEKKNIKPPTITVTHSDTSINIASQYFDNGEQSKQNTKVDRSRKRSHTSNTNTQQNDGKNNNEDKIKKSRAKSVPGKTTDKSKYFHDNVNEHSITKENNIKSVSKIKKEAEIKEDAMRISHRELVNTKTKPKNDVTNDLVDIIKKRVKEAKVQPKKGKSVHASDEDSDYLPELTEVQKIQAGPSKVNSKPGPSRKVDRRVFSTDDEAAHPNRNKIDTWCEVFVEELEQWVAVDVINGRTHCSNEMYNRATHPVAYVVGWDNNNYLKDLTRRYVPHWNTVTRKQRVDPVWWMKAIHPWLGPKTPRDKEEDDQLDRMQLEAPLPKSIAEYKNHPLYALKRHLLKFEAIYPPDAATLGFVRGEPVYARECVYTCRSRDTWLKEAKVVRLGETPYKVVKARPKWDKLSNKMITDKPLEVFGPWQVQDYEPPCAENGIVPRNAYGNVELFKECMLPKGTAHIKLPGLNRVARKLNIDCAPAMTGFDFNGGWSHPVYDGFVVCEEYKDIITNAWHEDQEDQKRKEQEKTETRVYGNWKRLIKKLIIREQLEHKYKFSESTSSQDKSTKKTSKGPRLATKKKCLDK